MLEPMLEPTLKPMLKPMESSALLTQTLTEAGVRSTIEQYFDSFNRKAFEQAAVLFGESGQLKPPFDSPLVGVEAIAQYLDQKAQNMTALPKQWQIQRLENNRWQVDVTGQVQAIAFTVNMAWQFIVNAEGAIDQAHIKLLASPHELLSLRPVAA
jgi:Nuclear transport factor 2 (NTF2) domain